MKVYEAGRSVDISLALVDDAGRTLVPTALNYSVYDDEGAVIQTSTAVTNPAPGATKVAFTVPAASNELSADFGIGYRRIALTITTSSSTFVQSADYLLEATQVFNVPSNSFQTYETSLIMARMITPLNGWDAASIETRKFALFRAFDLMNAFSYEMRYVDGTSEVLTVDEMTTETIASLSTNQIMDFRKAQLIQADYLLGGNPTEKDIQDGLQSSSIGEISQFYRPRPTLNLALCKAALSYVGKYIVWNMRIGRT